MRASDRSALPGRPLKLSALGMGCAAIGGLYEPIGEDAARAAIDQAWALGVRYFDTAPYYGFTLSERRLGAALRQRQRADYVVSTKVGRVMEADASVRPGDDGWACPLAYRPRFDYSYDGVMRSHEDSLDRLGLEHVDLLLVHDIGRLTHHDLHAHYWRQLTAGGGFRALEALRSDGRVGAIGLGVNETEVVADSMQEIDLDCTLLAGRYTLLDQAGLALLDQCAARGHAIVIGGPFNSGILAGGAMFNYQAAAPAIVRRVERLGALCARFGVPLPAAALQFPLAHPAVVSCIPGGRDAAQLRQNTAWFDYPIPPELWGALQADGLLGAAVPLPGQAPA